MNLICLLHLALTNLEREGMGGKGREGTRSGREGTGRGPDGQGKGEAGAGGSRARDGQGEGGAGAERRRGRGGAGAGRGRGSSRASDWGPGWPHRRARPPRRPGSQRKPTSQLRLVPGEGAGGALALLLRGHVARRELAAWPPGGRRNPSPAAQAGHAQALSLCPSDSPARGHPHTAPGSTQPSHCEPCPSQHLPAGAGARQEPLGCFWSWKILCWGRAAHVLGQSAAVTPGARGCVSDRHWRGAMGAL